MESQNEKKSDFDISKELGITEPKVRNLRVKSQLLYPKDIDYVEEVKNAIANGNYNVLTKEVTVVFRNPIVQNYIRNLLENEYRCVGINFNPKQLTLSIEDYLYFALLFEDKRDDVIDKLNKEFKNNEKIIGKIEKEKFTKGLFSNVVDMTTLLANVASLFVGGKPIIDAVLNLTKTSSSVLNNNGK